MLAYLIPLEDGEEGRRLFLGELAPGVLIPGMQVENDLLGNWVIGLVALDTARVEERPGDGDNIDDVRLSFAQAIGMELASADAFEEMLIEDYELARIKGEAAIINTYEEQLLIKERTLDIIASQFKKQEFSGREDVVETGMPLYDAAAMVCGKEKIRIAPVDRVRETSGRKFSVADIARVSHFVVRDIVLEENWHRKDLGAFLAWKEDDTPVACIPKGLRSYLLYDSTTGQTEKITDEVAAGIKPNACMFYRPFPAKPMLKGGPARFRHAEGLPLRHRAFAAPGAGRHFGGPAHSFDERTGIRRVHSYWRCAGAASAWRRHVSLCSGKHQLHHREEPGIVPLDEFHEVRSAGRHLRQALQPAGEFLQGLRLRKPRPARNGHINGLRRVGAQCRSGSGRRAVFAALPVAHVALFGRPLEMGFGHASRGVCGHRRFQHPANQVRTGNARRGRRKPVEGLPVHFRHREDPQRVGRRPRAVPLHREAGRGAADQHEERAAHDRGRRARPDGEDPVPLGVLLRRGPRQHRYHHGLVYRLHGGLRSFSAAVLALVQNLLVINQIQPLYEDARPILETVPEISDDAELPGDIQGEIELSNVTFAYAPDRPAVINDLSLYIHPGEYLGIVGSSGCGKSTLLKLLLGFEEPQIGGIYYDGHDINDLDKRELRKKFGVVLQDGGLISGSIAENIKIAAPNVRIRRLEEVIAEVGLKEDIQRMPMGIHTVVAEGAATLSGGQRQRILIARAIVAKPKVIFLDEATSALDNVTQSQVVDTLERLDATKVVIAHRLSTVKNCDRIIVLDAGQIVEEGDYDALMAKKGLFYDLAIRQI